MMAAQDQLESSEAARQFDDAHRQLVGDNSIQFELPTADDYSSPIRQTSPEALPRNLPQQHPVPPSAHPGAIPQSHSVPPDPSVQPPAPDVPHGGSGVDGLMQVFLWVAAGVALAILLYWIFAFFRDRHLGDNGTRKRKKKQA